MYRSGSATKRGARGPAAWREQAPDRSQRLRLVVEVPEHRVAEHAIEGAERRRQVDHVRLDEDDRWFKSLAGPLQHPGREVTGDHSGRLRAQYSREQDAGAGPDVENRVARPDGGAGGDDRGARDDVRRDRLEELIGDLIKGRLLPPVVP